jgi:glutathione synthase/RimK-type ligase-like ATP-grasp enzyme
MAANRIVMWPSVNKADDLPTGGGFVLIANPDSRRVTLFQQALARLEQSPARVVAYSELLNGRAHLSDWVRPGDVVRIESPGRDWDVEKQILLAGAEETEKEILRGGIEWISRQTLNAMSFERGRILSSRQWYLGWCKTLRDIQRQLADCPPHHLMNGIRDIALMFDKPRCQQILSDHGVNVPVVLGTPSCFDELREWMKQRNCGRVFIKLAHGSSASGVVAYRTNGHRHQATTTVETLRCSNELRLYNSRRIRVLDDLQEIAQLVDALCRHRVHVEEWIPKAGFAGRTFDVRVVVIDGQAQHSVMRLSRSPMTNLHLLNERAGTQELRSRIGENAWQAAMKSCEAAMSGFADSLYGGIDLLFTPDFKRHFVLEVNAFGDLLPATLWNGMDTYETEVRAMMHGEKTPC